MTQPLKKRPERSRSSTENDPKPRICAACKKPRASIFCGVVNGGEVYYHSTCKPARFERSEDTIAAPGERLDAYERCPQHPKYMALRRPKSCQHCLHIYNDAETQRRKRRAW